MRYTSREFAISSEVVQLDDMYFGQDRAIDLFPKISGAAWQMIAQGHAVIGSRPPNSPNIIGAIYALKRAYRQHDAYETLLPHSRDLADEPEWIYEIDPDVLASLRWDAMNDNIEPFAIPNSLPFTGFKYLVEEGGFVEDVVRAFKLWRLQKVAQLGALFPPVIGKAGMDVIAHQYGHTRYLHSLDVCALATLIAANNGLNEADTWHVRFAALTHDALTPAGGDSTKRLAPTLFDEDAEYPALYKRAEWPYLRAKYELDESKLTSIIRGEGILGRMLDLSDKLAYTARDVERFILSLPRGRTPDGLSMEQAAIRDMVARDPLICGLWDSLLIKDDQAYITQAEKLGRFLLLRAWMFKSLYYNPSARFHEDVTMKLFAGYLFEKGMVTRDWLLRVGDQELLDKVGELIGHPTFFTLMHCPLSPRLETFATLAEAKVRERELARDRSLITHLEVRTSYTSTGVKNWIVKVGTEHKPFTEAFSEEVGEIEKAIAMPNTVWLYIFSLKELELPKDLLVTLRYNRRKRLQ